MKISYRILPNGDLEFTADEAGRAYLAEYKADNVDAFGSDDTLHDIFEFVVTNDEYDWCEPAWAGALTSAPMLAIFGQDQPVPSGVDAPFVRIVGHWDGLTRYEPVEKCWGYMNYALNSPQEELLETGRCVWQAGHE